MDARPYADEPFDSEHETGATQHVRHACRAERAPIQSERRISTVREEVTDSMTPNWAGAVVNTLVLAFFVVIAIGVALGVYAARVMKKLEQKQDPETE
jgi:hypothetical protein